MLFSSHTHTEDPLYHPVVIKDKQRFWKRILIVDDNVDITVTFKTAIEDNNNITLTKKLRYIHLTILSWHCQNLSKTARHILLHMVIRNVKILLNYQYYGSSCSSRNLLSRTITGRCQIVNTSGGRQIVMVKYLLTGERNIWIAGSSH